MKKQKVPQQRQNQYPLLQPNPSKEERRIQRFDQRILAKLGLVSVTPAGFANVFKESKLGKNLFSQFIFQINKRLRPDLMIDKRPLIRSNQNMKDKILTSFCYGEIEKIKDMVTNNKFLEFDMIDPKTQQKLDTSVFNASFCFKFKQIIEKIENNKDEYFQPLEYEFLPDSYEEFSDFLDEVF